jgi:hypothetical protein
MLLRMAFRKEMLNCHWFSALPWRDWNLMICIYWWHFICRNINTMYSEENINYWRSSSYTVKYMYMCRQQNAGQNHNIKRADTSFEKAVNLKYTYRNGSNKTKLHSEKPRAQYNMWMLGALLFRMLFSPRLLPKKLKYFRLFFNMGKELRLSSWEKNRDIGKIFRERKEFEGRDNCIMRSSMISSLCYIITGYGLDTGPGFDNWIYLTVCNS